METQDSDIVEAYGKYFPMLRAKCGRMLSDPEEAEEVAQETFLRLLRGPVHLDPIQVTAWLYRTSTRLAVDRLRHRKRWSIAPLSSADEPTIEPDLDESVARRRLLARVADQVPPAELTAALLTRLDGASQDEAAEVMGVSDRTVRRLLRRFEKRMARLHQER